MPPWAWSGDEQPGLAAAGLTPAEFAAYELVIRRPGSPVAHLAVAWTHEERLDTVLAALDAKGFVRHDGDDPPRYDAVDPDLALEMPLADYERQLRRAHQRVRELAISHRHRSCIGEGATVIEVVTGRGAVVQRLGLLRRGARAEICSLDKPPYVDGPRTACDAAAARPGVAARAIYEVASVKHHGALRDVEGRIAAGLQARLLPTLPMGLHLVDRRYAFLPLRHEADSVESAIVVHPSALLDALARLFEGLWLRAVPLQTAAHTHAAGPSRRRTKVDEQRLVALLLTGLTDDVIARHLAVGYRTVQRHIATLMAGVGAHTRFQAGVQAALSRRHGRLRVPDR